MRALIALGGNAMTGPGGSATPQDQDHAIGVAMRHVADLVAAGVEVVLTHGNGPQVGNLLVKNELAAHVVPPVPLDWCVAQTQATLAFTIADELDAALAARGVDRRTVGIVTRTLVSTDDPGFREPSKPIGRFLPRAEAQRLNALRPVWGGPGASARSARCGRTAARRAGAASSPPLNRAPSSTGRPSRRSSRPASSSSARAGAASRGSTTVRPAVPTTQACAASRPSSTRT